MPNDIFQAEFDKIVKRDFLMHCEEALRAAMKTVLEGTVDITNVEQTRAPKWISYGGLAGFYGPDRTSTTVSGIFNGKFTVTFDGR